MRAKEQPPKLAYTIDQAAYALGLSRSRIYELIGTKDLQMGKLGGRSVILSEELKRFIEQNFKI